MAPKFLHIAIKLHGLSPRAANLIKQEALARGTDAALSWTVAGFKPDKTDMLLAGTLGQLVSLIAKLERQPFFGLPEVAAVLRDVIIRTIPDAAALLVE